MFVATVVLSVLLAVAFLATGAAKLAGLRPMRDNAAHLGFPYPAWRGIGVLEVAAAAGLLVGLAWAPLGVAAAVGLVLLMLGAAVLHLRHRDAAGQTVPSLAFALLAVLLLVARALS
ncbi:hypothetical protein GCM10022220_07460 [Actinocatenispora rupis]|uniref:DoxX-like family protein n=1 Tax=Actinocatenispora rupis TaxID=519421 RepID=A0A8J3JBD3_9ACTN|nr:hypothetical protein Aru02nite_25620 [Actinocatenispora rupis]